MARLAVTNFGHFTTMRVDGDRVAGLALHLDRLVRDCRTVFDADLDPGHVRFLVRRALAGLTQPVLARVTVFDPALEVGRPGADARPRVLVTTRPAPPGTSAPQRLRAVVYRRDLPEVKHVGLFGALHRRRAAQRAGFDDALFTEPDGTVSEATTANIGFVSGNRVVWPAADCLPGVTMRLVDRVHDDVATEPVTLARLPDFDAAFVTSAGIGLRPVVAVDDVRWPADHPTVRLLRERLAALAPEPLGGDAPAG